jgi:hypothetical protein
LTVGAAGEGPRKGKGDVALVGKSKINNMQRKEDILSPIE